MRQSAPSAILILGLIRDLLKVCQTIDWFFEDLHDYHCRASKLDLYCIFIRK